MAFKLLHSRVHRLNRFPDSLGACFIKRDDELSCGVSGTKRRKYQSLIEHCQAQGVKHLVGIGGAQSNNVLALAQVAREHGFKLSVFLLKPWRTPSKGNFKLTELFLSKGDIHWVERTLWPEVESLAMQYISQLSEPGFLVREGASVKEALEGAESLAFDIIANEQELGRSFKHIFIDAGTGFSAIALIKAMAERGHQALIHVLLLAQDLNEFNESLAAYVSPAPDNYRAFLPTTAKAFGSVNATIKQSIKRMAYEEGVLVDPIYSAKLFHEARLVIERDALMGNKLIVHSGGALSLAAFI